MNEKVTFSFGENWEDYLNSVAEDEIEEAKEDIQKWLSNEEVDDKSILDIGSGSGIHSLAFQLLGAKEILSVDYDIASVRATSYIRDNFGREQNWSVEQASILDDNFIEKYKDKFDIIYSWGVLHHTGNMDLAIENTIKLAKNNSTIWISIYQAGPRYEKDLKLKRFYNNQSDFFKKVILRFYITRIMLGRLRRGWNPFKWNVKVFRGMNMYNNLIDWLGGLPYEVADSAYIVEKFKPHGFYLTGIESRIEGACSIYKLERKKL